MEATLLKYETVYNALRHVLRLTCPSKSPSNCAHHLCAYLRSSDGNSQFLEIVTSFLAMLPNEFILAIPKNRGHPLTYKLAMASGIAHSDILHNLPPCTLFTVENTRITLSFTPVEEGLATILDEQRLTIWQPDDRFTNFENR